MKVGILTVYFADYGSFFQAMALCKTIRDFGYNCEIINESLRAKGSWKLKVGRIASQYFPCWLNALLASRTNEFEKYLLLKKDIALEGLISKPYRNYSDLSKEYDCLVIGSDELWAFTQPTIRYIPAYFGIGVDCPCISYAPSAASLTNPAPAILHNVKHGLSRFHALSVRDRTTQNWIADLTDIQPELVVDPTLLNPFFVPETPLKQSDFILVYGEHFNEKFIGQAKRYARKIALPLKSVSWQHDWCDEHLRLTSAYDLQRAFSASRFCFISSMHGTIFSILHQKPFLSVVTEKRGQKVRDLLDMLHLHHRLYETGKAIEDHESIDYGAVMEKIDSLRASSMAYLKNALETVGKRNV